MPFDTDEVRAIKVELESDLKDAVTGLRHDLRDLKSGLKGLVTAAVCDAKHDASAAHVTSLEQQIRATEGRIVDAVQLVKGEISEMVNGKLEVKLREMVPTVLRDPEFRASVQDVTERMRITELQQRKRPPTGAFTKLGNSAKSLTAIITLAVMLIGGCVTGSYYLVGIANLVKQATQTAQLSATRQEKLLREQVQVVQRLEDRPAPTAVTVGAATEDDLPARPAVKVHRRAAAVKRAVSP